MVPDTGSISCPNKSLLAAFGVLETQELGLFHHWTSHATLNKPTVLRQEICISRHGPPSVLAEWMPYSPSSNGLGSLRRQPTLSTNTLVGGSWKQAWLDTTAAENLPAYFGQQCRGHTAWVNGVTTPKVLSGDTELSSPSHSPHRNENQLSQMDIRT